MLSILLDKHAHKKGVLERIENKVLLIRLFLKSEWTGFFFCVPWLKKVFPIWYESIGCRIGKITKLHHILHKGKKLMKQTNLTNINNKNKYLSFITKKNPDFSSQTHITQIM